MCPPRLIVMLAAMLVVGAWAEEPLRTKAQLVASIPSTDIFGPAELTWCTTVFELSPSEVFITLHKARYVVGSSSSGSNFAIHQRGTQGYRTLFRCVTDGVADIEMPLLCRYRPVGEQHHRQLVYFKERSTGTDGNIYQHLLVLNEDGSIQEVECETGLKLPFAKDETAWYSQPLFRDDDLAFVCPVFRIDKQAKQEVGEHIADFVGSYRLVANPPVDPPTVVKPFRLEIQSCQRRALTKPGE